MAVTYLLSNTLGMFDNYGQAMETLKSTIKQEKHNREKTPYVGILQSCPKINNNARTKYTKSQHRITHSADVFLDS